MSANFKQAHKGSSNKYLMIFILIQIIFVSCFSLEVENKQVYKIFLKTCQGWCLKGYPIVKLFIEQDFDHYNQSLIEIDYVGGGFPRLVLVDEKGDNIKTYDISKLSREQIRQVFKALQINLIKPLRPLEEVDPNKVIR